MDLEKEWFKLIITIGGAFGLVWMLFFNKNNRVFEILIKTLEARMDKFEDFVRKQDERIDEWRDKSIKMETLFQAVMTKWDEMSNRYDAREAALIKSNELKDEELKIMTGQLSATKELQEYQKSAYKATLDTVLEIQKGVFKEIIKDEKGK